MDPKQANVRNWNNISAQPLSMLTSCTHTLSFTPAERASDYAISLYKSICLEMANFCKTDLKHTEIFHIYSTTMTQAFFNTKVSVNIQLFRALKSAQNGPLTPCPLPLDEFAFCFLGKLSVTNTLENGRKQPQGQWQCHSGYFCFPCFTELFDPSMRSDCTISHWL